MSKRAFVARNVDRWYTQHALVHMPANFGLIWC